MGKNKEVDGEKSVLVGREMRFRYYRRKEQAWTGSMLDTEREERGKDCPFCPKVRERREN